MTVITEQTILITGCSRRLGYLLGCHFLAKNFRVLAHYRTPTHETEQLKSQGAILLQADFTQSQHIIHFIEQVKSLTNELRGIIHNASMFAPDQTEPQAILEQYHQLYQVHMVAPALINHELKATLQQGANPYSDIIHITDIAVNHPHPNCSLYSSTKAGLENLTLSFAKNFAPQIKVNSIQPGTFEFLTHHTEAEKANILNETLLKRIGGFETIIKTVDYLLDNHYITGSAIKVDGGHTLI
ncbi:MAG: SDR family oxidoreductase [Planktothrix sp.]|uniref:SDR family oxidoreductase n=1 Tax=Planktothrix sp. TaxID=3088171 RepID=UPI0038D36050